MFIFQGEALKPFSTTTRLPYQGSADVAQLEGTKTILEYGSMSDMYTYDVRSLCSVLVCLLLLGHEGSLLSFRLFILHAFLLLFQTHALPVF